MTKTHLDSRHIAVYADDLAVSTSSVPNRDMLRHLLPMRAKDRFTFVFCNGSQSAGWWSDYSVSLCHSKNWSTYILPYTRRMYNMTALIGLGHRPAIPLIADIYLRFDSGAVGRHRVPLINLIADLSALRTPETASLKWHGKILFRLALREGASVAARTVCISDFTRADVAEYLPELSSRLVTIRNGLSDEWFRGEEVKASMLPAGYLIWYGCITPRKNVAGLIDAYARALGSIGGAIPDLIIVGSGSHLIPHVIEKVRQRSLEDRVYVLPPQPLQRLVTLVSASRGARHTSFDIKCLGDGRNRCWSCRVLRAKRRCIHRRWTHSHFAAGANVIGMRSCAQGIRGQFHRFRGSSQIQCAYR